MGHVCPHCNAWLPVVVDCFCPECRKTLSDPPTQNRSTAAHVSATNQQPSPVIWYATELRLKSPFKLVMLDDRGTLELLPHRVRFTGKNGIIDCCGVHDA